MSDLLTSLQPYLHRFLGGMLVFAIGWFVVRQLVRRVGPALDRSALDPTLRPILKQVIRIALLFLVLLVALGTLGVQTASLVAIVGAAGLAIGLALQGTLSNVAAGTVLLVQRPFNVGDFVDLGGQMGTVERIGLLATELRAPDGVFLTMQNLRVWNSDIRNMTRATRRRFDLTVGITYSEDIDRAIALVHDVIAQEGRALHDPAPLVAVSALSDSSVDLLVRVWTAGPDWWPTQLDLRKAIKQRFDQEGVPIPFPQRDLHIISADPFTAARVA